GHTENRVADINGLPSFGNRQPHDKRCTKAIAGARDVDRAAMQFYQVLRNGQDETKSPDLAHCRGVRLPKSHENVGQEMRRTSSMCRFVMSRRSVLFIMACVSRRSSMSLAWICALR